MNLKEHVEHCTREALAGRSKLDAKVLGVRGFSTPTMRHLFNNLCSDPVKRYLEIGVWHGATATAAAYKNLDLTSFLVDDLSQDFNYGPGWNGGHVLEDLQKNLDLVRGDSGTIHFINENCWSMDKSAVTDIDLYFFDGRHEVPDQSKALPEFLPCMSDSFIFIVDDACWEPVKKGTIAGLEAVRDKIDVECSWLHRPVASEDRIWHNGVDIYLCRKK